MFLIINHVGLDNVGMECFVGMVRFMGEWLRLDWGAMGMFGERLFRIFSCLLLVMLGLFLLVIFMFLLLLFWFLRLFLLIGHFRNLCFVCLSYLFKKRKKKDKDICYQLVVNRLLKVFFYKKNNNN